MKQNTGRSWFLDVEELSELLNIPKHEIRSLMVNDDPDVFPFELSTFTPRGGGHTPLSAFMGVR
jgi:hypothetical protein